MSKFKVQELVSPEIYAEFGEESLSQFTSDKALNSLYALRELINLPITVNNWHKAITDWTGDLMKQVEEYEKKNKISLFKYRGLRPADCKVGAKGSAHKTGLAIDCDAKGKTAEQLRQFIIDNQKSLPFITRLEADVNWCHFDCKYTGNDHIIIFKP